MSAHIVFVHKLFPFSGAERVTIDVANHLASMGYRISVLTPQHCRDRYPQGAPCRYEVVEMPACRLKVSRKAASFIRDYVEQNDVKCIVSYRELLYMPWLKRKTGVRFVYVLHNMVGYEFVGNDGVFKIFNECFYRSKYRRIFHACDAYGVLCPQYTAEVMQMLGNQGDESKIHVLPNPIHSGQGNPDACMDKQKEVLYVGRLSRRDKHVERLLEVWKRVEDSLTDWRLTIVGTGRDETALKTMAAALGLKNVSFEGYQRHVQPYYDRAAIICLTSSFEGWPMTIGEAQMNGVIPIVYESFAGARDMIEDGVSGRCIPPFEGEVFAKALVEIATDERLQLSMRQAALAKASTYSVARTGAAWQDLFKKLGL
ncbi:MAG: glycosyltransferase [Bacteroidales bacterium]|nr:glycosyltransferase [Candidatus Physcousia equi]